MTTAFQVRRLFRDFVSKHPDLALSGRFIVVKPVRHIMRGILIDRTSDANALRPVWLTYIMFEPRTGIPLTWGEDIRFIGRGYWRLDDPTTGPNLVHRIEEEVLPIIRGVASIADFYAFSSSARFHDRPFNRSRHRKVLVDIALGNLAAACETCAEMEARRETWESSILREEFIRTMELYSLILADDRPTLARRLHNWEAQTVKNLKLEHLWEPSPFPLERAGGGLPSSSLS